MYYVIFIITISMLKLSIDKGCSALTERVLLGTLIDCLGFSLKFIGLGTQWPNRNC